MNIALIIAGGIGHRIGQGIPKQFINVYDKPVILYTLEGFQVHPQIDAIEVVCALTGGMMYFRVCIPAGMLRNMYFRVMPSSLE